MRNIRVPFGLRLFLAMAGIVLTVSIFIYILVAAVFEEKMRDTTRYQLEQQTEQAVSSTEFYLNQLRSIYLNITSDYMLIQTFVEGYNRGVDSRLQYPIRKIDTLSTVYSWVYTIYMYDPNSGLFFNGNSLTTTELVDDTWLQNAKKSNGMYHFIVLEEDRNSANTHKASLSVGGPIHRNFTGVPVAYFSIQVALDTLRNRIFPASFSQGTFYTMYDDNGSYLFGDLKDWKLDTGTPSFSQVTYQSKSYIQFTQTSTKYGWTFLILTPSSEMYTGIDKIRKMAIPMVGCALICALLLSLFLAWRFTRPIAILTRAIASYRGNDEAINTIPNLGRNDEFQVLNDGLINMTGRINHLIEDVYQGKLQKKEMELKMLYQSMDPHFIYNVLDSINWQVVLGKTTEASQALIALSHYLRGTMFRHTHWTTLEKSREEINAYNRLQVIFYSQEIHCKVNFPEDLLLLCIPSMLLQPIVENCYTHGYPDGYKGRLSIEVEAHLEQEALVISVSDNGVGIPGDYLEELQGMLEDEQVLSIRDRDPHFFALRNVQSRIHIQCGREWGLTVESHEPGTVVTVRLPVRPAGQEGDADYVESDDSRRSGLDANRPGKGDRLVKA